MKYRSLKELENAWAHAPDGDSKLRKRIDILAVQFLGELERWNSNRMGHNVIDFVVLSFLIERFGVTVDDIEKRADLVRSTLGGDHDTDDVKLRTDYVISVLKSRYPQKSSPTWKPTVIEGGLAGQSNNSPPEGEG